MFFSYKKRTKRILNMIKGESAGYGALPCFVCSVGDAEPCNDP